METGTLSNFDAAKYKQTTLEQWETAAAAWYRWSPLLRQWLGKATDRMIEMAGIREGHAVLDVAAGAGDQSITAAGKAGASGHVLATDISPAILDFAKKMALETGYKNIGTRVMDGENLDLPD